MFYPINVFDQRFNTFDCVILSYHLPFLTPHSLPHKASTGRYLTSSKVDIAIYQSKALFKAYLCLA